MRFCVNFFFFLDFTQHQAQNHLIFVELLTISTQKFHQKSRYKDSHSKPTLCEMPQFYLISWCRNFVERHSFCICSVILKLCICILKLCGNCAFPQNFHTRKLGEITVFNVVRGSKITTWVQVDSNQELPHSQQN